MDINIDQDGSRHAEAQPEIPFALAGSSTKQRVGALRRLNQSLQDRHLLGKATSGKTVTDTTDETNDYFAELLFKTYPLYVDSVSRNAVVNILRDATFYPPHSQYFLAAYFRECSRPGLAPSSAFTLVKWGASILLHCASDITKFQDYGTQCIESLALVLEICTRSHKRSRQSLSKAANQSVVNSLKRLSVAVPTDAFTKLVQKLCKSKAAGARTAPMLGAISEACLDQPCKLFSSKTAICDFYVREILGSKTSIPINLVKGLDSFFRWYLSEDEFSDYLVPALLKAMLRTPETVLVDLLPGLIDSIATNLDLGKTVATNLLKPLLASVRSQNEQIRNASVLCLGKCATRCHNESDLGSIAKQLFISLQQSKAPMERHAIARMLDTLANDASLATFLLKTLAPIIEKEPHETTLLTEITTLFTACRQCPPAIAPEIVQAVRDVTMKGIRDKRAPIKRAWVLAICDAVGNPKEQAHQTNSIIFEILATAADSLARIFKDVVEAPLVAVQDGTLVIAFSIMAIIPLCSSCDQVTIAHLQSEVRAAIVSTTTSKSELPFFADHKLYTKLHVTDMIWVAHALSSCADRLEQLPPGFQTAWGQAFIYVNMITSAHRHTNEITQHQLRTTYLRFPILTFQCIVAGIWVWIKDSYNAETNSSAISAKVELQHLRAILRCILPIRGKGVQAQSVNAVLNKTNLQKQLIELLVLCQPNVIPGAHWIEICLNADVDPGDLVSSYSQNCWNSIQCCIATEKRDPCAAVLNLAAYNTAVELAFVSPESMIPLINENVGSLLGIDGLKQIGPLELAIARVSDGTAFVDVLSSERQEFHVDKKSPDYELKKWEDEIRKENSKRKGENRKFTANEMARIHVQIDKEATIRRKVLVIRESLEQGIGFIHALAVGPPTDARLWLGTSCNLLLRVIRENGGALIGSRADDAFIACAQLISARLGIARNTLAITTLRAFDSTSLAIEYLSENLHDLSTRMLQRLHFLGGQRPFDTVTLLFLMPFIAIILREAGLGVRDPESSEEQVTLAIEFLEYHVGNYADKNLPREDIFQMLVDSMQKYPQHHRVLRDILFGICQLVGSDLNDEEMQPLFDSVICPQPNVRSAVLQAIREHVDITRLEFSIHIWLACHDESDENAALAQAIWKENALEIEVEHSYLIIPYLSSKDIGLRRSAARALVDCIDGDIATFHEVFERLQADYREFAKARVPERDNFGALKKFPSTIAWEGRSGIAMAFQAATPMFPSSELVPLIGFLIQARALADDRVEVREEMIEAATSVISKHGATKLEELMQQFETALDQRDENSGVSDLLNEAVVILYGALARHLPESDHRIRKVILRLLATLSTPSETVQYAVAGCLPPLVKKVPQEASTYIQVSIDELLQTKKFATRRGAAYGLAGIVHGNGISSLKECRILSNLRAAIENRKEQNQREGALFAYELLALILGPVFEPYIIQIVPQLLASFGDANADVRQACLDAAKSCFANLSSYGVKIILPTLLEGLEDTQWRSKRGACELLGAMAYLDPQQLAMSLPEIIPPLTNVLNDSHKEIRAAANRSLQRFGEVISNPEVKSLVGILLKALSDPTKYTEDALEALIKVSFVHYLDAPSLALIVRILQRGLGDRSATKRKSAQIIGSLAHLTERKDVLPHLPILISGLRDAAVDPVPATRATASKALGSIVEKLGEDALPDLIPSLMSTLKADTGAGDRLGSAQALSEVLAGLGISRLEEILPTIIQNVSSAKASVREGFMSLFIYLPACFGNSFANYLSRVIPSILSGLADDIESIRETALRAGRLLVKNFATKAIDLLLPELDRGLADDNHRIRLSSVELVGDLLFNLTGISGSAEQEEGEVDDAAEAGQSLLEVLGEDKRNKILSSLYICRCDTSGLVRTAAINVWKALVPSPRILKELVPTLTQLIIRRLASSNAEQKLISGNALGELMRKAGDGVLSTLLPTLQEGLETSTDVDHRQGICIALREITASAAPETLEDYEKILLSVVRVALVDADGEVREAAAEAFDSLQQVLGKRAVDQVLPNLLSLLRSVDSADTALSALLTLLTDSTRSNIILPNLVPTLLESPMSAFNAKAIASLVEVASSSMTRRLPVILSTVMNNIVDADDEKLRSELEDAFDTILISVDEYDGLNTTMSVMLSMLKNADHRKRVAANVRLSNFFAEYSNDYARYHQDLIRVLLISFDDSDSDVVRSAWLALSELTKKLKKEEMESLVASTRQSLLQVGIAGVNLPGFLLPKGITAILPIFLQGLMNGTADQRTIAALAISDIINRTNAESLKPFITQITGPLIRVISERSIDLRCAILLTLNHLLEKVPTLLKPFLPQLQRTFAKCLGDSSSGLLRSRAARALGTLITLTPRIDPLIAELVTGTKTADLGVRTAMLKALYEVIKNAGSNMSEASRSSVLGVIDSDLDSGDDDLIITHARLFGALIKSLHHVSNASALLKSHVMTTHLSTSSALNLNAVLLECPMSLANGFAHDLPILLCHGLNCKIAAISENFILATGKYLLTPSGRRDEASKSLIEALTALIEPGQNADSRRLALVVVRTVSRLEYALISPFLSTLVPSVFASVRDPIIPIKLAAEAAFLSIFSVADHDSETFDEFMKDGSGQLNVTQKRSMQDYFKRVALRLGNQARERREAEGGQGGLGLSNDEREDEREIWSVGKVDLGKETFKDE